MTKTSSIDFKLKDPFHTHKKVNVAGSFNNWDPSVDSLLFDGESNYWALNMPVDLPKGHKVIYKYIVDENKWICESSAPLEKDSEGNENNVSYVIVKSTENGDNNNNDNDYGDDTVSQIKDGEFDHKSFHEKDLFDGTERADETAPTSGEESSNEQTQFPEKSIPNSSPKSTPVSESNPNSLSSTPIPPKEDELITHEHNKNKDNSNIPKTDGNFTFASFWESFKWFFKYYILSWFHSDAATTSA